MAGDTPATPEEGEGKKGKKRERKPKEPKLRKPGREAGWLLPTVGLAISILIGLVVAVFGSRGETDLRLIGPILPAVVGACCCTSGTIAYGIVGLIACVLLWGIVFFR